MHEVFKKEKTRNIYQREELFLRTQNLRSIIEDTLVYTDEREIAGWGRVGGPALTYVVDDWGFGTPQFTSALCSPQ